MNGPDTKCFTCGRSLLPGDNAWASDWTVLVTHVEHVETGPWRTETRYTCDPCGVREALRGLGMRRTNAGQDPGDGAYVETWGWPDGRPDVIRVEWAARDATP